MVYSKADWSVIKAVTKVVEQLRRSMFVPNPATRYKPGGSTGNLAFNALRIVIEDKAIKVYVDEKIAPYVPYTNEPWISPYWRGKKNPNEGWWQRFADEFMRRLAKELKGEIK